MLKSSDPTYEKRLILQACAHDTIFFGKHFFPAAIRQKSPIFHQEMADAIENPTNRRVSFEIARDFAKTTLARIVTAKRIAFAVSRTIVYTSKSQSHAIASVDWVRKAIMYNKRFADFFQLRPGKPWTEDDIEILHGIDGISIRMVALGMTGQLRGFNFENYRPDFIICDDPDNEETTSTPEQREKTSDLFFGALLNSLAPASEAPLATIALLQTPLDREDLVETTVKDPTWVSVKYGCFNEFGKSRWPSRYPTEVLLEEKAAAIARNQLHIWMREKECTIVSAEGKSFKPHWLNYYDILPEDIVYFAAIDPAIAEAYKKGSKQVSLFLGVSGKKIFLVAYDAVRGQNPEQLCMAYFSQLETYKPCIKTKVETVAYQKALAWYIRKRAFEMQKFPVIQEYTDRRSKRTRITDAILSCAPAGNLYIKKEHEEFIQEYMDFPNDKPNDVLDTFAIALSGVTVYDLAEGDGLTSAMYGRSLPPLDQQLGCP